MNERMLELYRQAHLPHTAIDPSNNMPYETMTFSANKFAELIVRECIGCCDIVSKIEWPETPTYDLAIDGCKLKMKQHFGVEE